MRWLLFALSIALILPLGAAAQTALTARPGWVVIDTAKPFEALSDDLKSAVRAAGFGVVTQAGPTATARARGIDIPGNRVIGVFNNVYAVRILRLSAAAMIEAPVRFYITERADGGATLSYKTPGLVFGPYFDEGGPDLEAASAELDAAFAEIAQAATR